MLLRVRVKLFKCFKNQRRIFFAQEVTTNMPKRGTTRIWRMARSIRWTRHTIWQRLNCSHPFEAFHHSPRKMDQPIFLHVSCYCYDYLTSSRAGTCRKAFLNVDFQVREAARSTKVSIFVEINSGLDRILTSHIYWFVISQWENSFAVRFTTKIQTLLSFISFSNSTICCFLLTAIGFSSFLILLCWHLR